jgi:hypothetical protein
MVRRFASEAIGDQIDQRVGQPAGLERNLDNVCRRRLNLGDRQHARRDKRAIRAAIVFLFVRAAWHVAGHSGHVAHLANRQRFCRSRRYQRCSNEPNDHKDREQTTDESRKIHDPPSHGTGSLGRLVYFTCLPTASKLEKGAKSHVVNCNPGPQPISSAPTARVKVCRPVTPKRTRHAASRSALVPLGESMVKRNLHRANARRQNTGFPHNHRSTSAAPLDQEKSWTEMSRI